jgi:hypothetical protein
MKPSFMQMFFAKHWPLKFWMAVIGAISIFMACRACEPSLSSLHDWHFLVLFVSVIVLAPVLACYSSLMIVWLFLGPIYRIRGRMNGAPFHPGDYVQVLVGPNRGRVFQVDVIWEQRGQVCLELGSPRRKGVQFAFAYTQVFRVVLPNKSPEPTAVGAVSSAIAVRVAGRRWLSFFR